MTTGTRTGYRGATAGVLAVGGGATAIAAWVNGDHGLAIGLLVTYALAAVVAFIWSGGTGDVAAIIRAGGDERQQSIGREAIAITGMVMVLAALVGVVVETATKGDPGSYGVMSAVGGLSYAVSLAVLHHSR